MRYALMTSKVAVAASGKLLRGSVRSSVGNMVVAKLRPGQRISDATILSHDEALDLVRGPDWDEPARDYSAMLKADLLALAEAVGVTVSSNMTKAAIIAAIEGK